MKLNEDLIREYVNKSNDILCKYIPNYEPINPMTLKVKISKMKSAWANIKRIKMGRICHYELKVSDIFNYIDNDSKAEMKLMSTIIHELIHTIPGCFNHGVNFQACAYMISSKTCYKITTSANSANCFWFIPFSILLDVIIAHILANCSEATTSLDDNV